MKISLNWIRQYIDLPADLSMEKLSYDLTMRTVEVEGAENPADSLQNVVVGIILKVEPHPQADLLRICTVDVGQTEPSTIVCGGSNVKKGMSVVVAVPGSFVRWHGEGEPVEIKPTKLRGVKSDGMICAASELDMGDLFPAGDDHEVMDLSGFSCKAGDLVADVLELNDIVLEIDNKSLTNRPDLWGHYGIARELSAIYKIPLKPLPSFQKPENLPSYPVTIQNSERCRRYTAMVYEGLSVSPSPYWLKLSLWKTGVRPINNLVDLTNYVMLSVGQPTHGFDRNHVQGEIIVRTACEGEKLTLLDERELSLRKDDLVICDAKEPMALAGIMGGAKDSILPDTTEMILEIANFEPISLRRTARHYQVHTESASRNEKSLDTQRMDQAMGVAHQLITDLFPKVKLTAFHDCQAKTTAGITVPVSLAWLSKRLGRALTTEDVSTQLAPLGFTLAAEGDLIRIEVPSWRATGDVSLQDDILEEMARMIGYDSFDFIPPAITLTQAIKQPGVQAERSMREFLAFRCNMQEIFTYPWVEQRYIEAAGLPLSACLKLSTPPSPETAHLRSSLVPGMLSAVAHNLRYFDSFRIFEVAQVFTQGETHPSDSEETLPLQQRSLCGGLIGDDGKLLFREAKGVLETLPRIAMTDGFTFGQVEKATWADKNGWLNLLSGTQMVGTLGVVSPKAARLAGIKHASVVLFELNLEKTRPLPSRSNSFEHLPLFPLVQQDFSMLIDETVNWQEVEQTIGKTAKRIEFMEEYRGKQVPEGKKSLMFRVWFGSDTETLTTEEIDEKKNSIIKKINKRLGGEIRA